MILFSDATKKKMIFDQIMTKVEFKINFLLLSANHEEQISESVFVSMVTLKDAMFWRQVPGAKGHLNLPEQ